MLVHQSDWLGSLLHGEPGWSDWNNALKLGFDPAAESYPGWLEGDARFAPMLPPKVLAPGQPQQPVSPGAAQDLGLSPDCLVVSGTTDSIAAFLAANGIPSSSSSGGCVLGGVDVLCPPRTHGRWFALSPSYHPPCSDRFGDAVTSLGSTLAVKMISDKPVEDARFGVYSHRIGDTWLVGEPLFSLPGPASSSSLKEDPAPRRRGKQRRWGRAS